MSRLRWISLGLFLSTAPVLGQDTAKPEVPTRPAAAKPERPLADQGDQEQIQNLQRALDLLQNQSSAVHGKAEANRLKTEQTLSKLMGPAVAQTLSRARVAITKEDLPIGAVRLSVTTSNGFGLDLVKADPVLRSQLNLAEDQGLVVVAITPNGLADQAGLKVKDLVLRLNNEPATSETQAFEVMSKVARNAIEVELIREGKPRRLSLVGPEHGKPEPTTAYWIGVPVSPVDATLRSHLPALPADAGLVVDSLVPESPAAKGGLLKNDIMVKLDDKLLANSEALIEQIQKSGGKEVKIEVFRGSKPLVLKVTPVKKPVADNEFVVGLARPDGDPLASKKFYYSQTRPYVVQQPGKRESSDIIIVNPYNVDGFSQATIDRSPGAYSIPGFNPGFNAMPVPGQVFPTPDVTARLAKEVNDLTKQIDDLRKVISEMNKNQPAAKDGK